jgi:dihydropteroate synthase
MRPVFEWSLGTRSLRLGKRTLVMGVINVTPDSFSDGGLHFDRDRAVEYGLQLLDEGADIIDVGGESTRPGAKVLP